MPDVIAKPYGAGASNISIESDSHTSACGSWKLTPTTPTAEWRDVGGGVQTVVGTPSWVLEIKALQDWTTDASLVHLLRLNHGQTKTVKLDPIAGDRGVTVDIVCQAGEVSTADPGNVASSTIQLRVNGQPVWDAEPEA